MQLFDISDESICFTAYVSSDPRSHVPSVIIYDRVTTNKGSGYNTADGVFTAPLPGTYLFIWNSVTVNGNLCYLTLFKNGARVDLSAYSDARSFSTVDSGSMSVVLEMTTSDRVWVQNTSCGYLYGSQFISFSGCKIWHKDKKITIKVGNYTDRMKGVFTRFWIL